MFQIVKVMQYVGLYPYIRYFFKYRFGSFSNIILKKQISDRMIIIFFYVL